MIETINYINYTDYLKELLPYVKFPIDKLLLLGSGEMNADGCIEAETRLAVEWADDCLLKIKDKKGLIPIKFDAKHITEILVPKSFDTVVMFDFLEHLVKRDGEKLLNNIEKYVKQQILMFIPLENRLRDKEDIARTVKANKNSKKNNVSMGNHSSQWTPEEMEERGFKVLVSPFYHKERNWGAMICIKDLWQVI